ncbi:unnamed protein product [Clonostachys byssicola]|uniref:Phytanoyl-dioxygenase family protein n=1 Tax=Clonostachys byssicola TaxID=160290 RepID=A0A9N9USF9_9HYPO|nr:unnamed protein product [Clonostachys byssicola]
MALSKDDRRRSLPDVQAFDAATANVDDIVAALIVAGGCVLKGAVAQDDLAQIEKDTRICILGDKAWGGDFFPKETKRVMGLIGKSPTFTRAIVQSPLAVAAAEKILTSTYSCWVGDEWKTFVSKPQLNNTIIFSIAPGARNQELHRDDMIHHNPVRQRTAADYKIGDDTGVGYFVAGKKATKDNGVTRFIPGSHLWGQTTPPDESLTFYAEIEAGDAFLFLSSCYHGGSANKTADQERLMYSCFYTKGFLRQEENQYLSAPFEAIKGKYDQPTLELLGYNLSPPFMGWVEMKHPLEFLTGTESFKDLY